MSGIAGLIERLEKLEAPSREVDVGIALALLDAKREPNWYGWQSSRPQGTPEKPVADFWRSRDRCPLFTASLDAATALVERVLPGWDWTAARSGQAYGGYVYPLDFSPSDNPNEVSAVHRTNAAIALCLALLRALQQEEKR